MLLFSYSTEFTLIKLRFTSDPNLPYSAQVTITKTVWQLKQHKLIFLVLEAGKPIIKVLDDSVSGEVPLLACGWPLSLYAHMTSCLCTCRERDLPSLSFKALIQIMTPPL